MKTFLAIVLCLCVGCGVSEQEKLAKRINDKMDREEKRINDKMDREEEVNRTTKIGLERARADLKKKYPLIFNDKND